MCVAPNPDFLRILEGTSRPSGGCLIVRSRRSRRPESDVKLPSPVSRMDVAIGRKARLRGLPQEGPGVPRAEAAVPLRTRNRLHALLARHDWTSVLICDKKVSKKLEIDQGRARWCRPASELQVRRPHRCRPANRANKVPWVKVPIDFGCHTPQGVLFRVEAVRKLSKRLSRAALRILRFFSLCEPMGLENWGRVGPPRAFALPRSATNA